MQDATTRKSMMRAPAPRTAAVFLGLSVLCGFSGRAAAADASATPTKAMMSGMTMDANPRAAASSAPAKTAVGEGMSDMRGMGEMRSAANLADPMRRAGSGTSWQPDSSQLFGYMRMHGGRMEMAHFAAFPRYVATGSERGSRRADLPNWGMGMYALPLGPRSQLGLRAMMSLDPLTENGQGYPLLFQSGETWRGESLHDRQHPHDLFSELSATFSTRLARRGSAYLTVGYPGEPALGPPTFMHRRIAYDMPDAPIGHHWQDATHVTFGTMTAGVAGPGVKIEASAFTGREPNEARTNFDPVRLDSFSTRLSWMLGSNIAGQVSEGFLHSPEGARPDADVHRVTASLLYNRAIARAHNLYAAATFGQNYEPGHSRTNAYLLEFDYQKFRDTVYARAERTGKTGEELASGTGDRIADVGHVTVGYVRDVARAASTIETGLGAQITRGVKPAALSAAYGGGAPYGYEIFVRLRPREL